jgi:hypothetical protein
MAEDYTGHVEPDGAWKDRVDGQLFVRKLSVEEFDNNCYVIACTRTREALLVDVAARPPGQLAHVVLALADDADCGAKLADGLDLVLGDEARHADGCGNAEPIRRVGQRPSVIACRSADHAARRFLRRKP